MAGEADNIIGIYRRHAHAWLQLRGAHLMERKWLDRFLALQRPQPNVLDIGCGTGEPMARHLIGGGCRITGIDASPEMIAIAQDRFPGATWQVADMRTLSLTDTFDGLLAWDSFFHLGHADQRRMFPVFRRHATYVYLGRS